MADMLNLMWLPFLACVVVIGIHVYFGVHVLKRGVIFVDLALAQIAALGTTVAFLFGIDPESAPAYVFSLAFITAAALIFTFTRTREQKIPQEAIIGIVYAVATAAAILVADRSAHGAEHIKEMLTGAILWVGPKTVASYAVVYAVIGLFHFLCRRQFSALSESLESAQAAGVPVRLWDFLFYASLGIMVSLSVRVAGVLLVFCFLIVPAVISAFFAERMWQRLLVGWGAGIFVSILGLLFSWAYDYPSGPSVACFFGLALIVSAAARHGAFQLDRRTASWPPGTVRGTKVIGTVGIMLAALLLVLVPALKHRPPGATDASEHSHDPHVQAHEHGEPSSADVAALMASLSTADADGRQQAAVALAERAARRALPCLITRLTEEDDDSVREALVQAVVSLGDESTTPALRKKLEGVAAPGATLALATTLVRLGDLTACPALVGLLADDSLETIKYRQAALDLLQPLSGDDFGYDALGDAKSNAAALGKWRQWAAGAAEHVPAQ